MSSTATECPEACITPFGNLTLMRPAVAALLEDKTALDQATDRAFRIGQKRNVIVHKFVCRGTLEERIDDMIRAKRELSTELFSDNGEISLTEMSNEELMRFVSLDLTKATTA